jgi:heme exporter protein A
LLEVRDLECVRGERSLFRSLSFVVEAGDTLRVEGANGTGKTTLLRTLCGLSRPEAGTILWRGSDIASLEEEFRAELLYLGHAPAVKDELTAQENVLYAAHIAGLACTEDDAAAALAAIGLRGREEVAVRHLSQGQRRRVGLARLTLATKPPLWVLDEPFTALDPQAVSLIGSLIRSHAGQGGAVILTTHHDGDLDGHAVRRVCLDS